VHAAPRRWGEVSGKHISLQVGDICDWEFFADAFSSFQPDSIVHFGGRRRRCCALAAGAGPGAGPGWRRSPCRSCSG
jgi:hypothetical protein